MDKNSIINRIEKAFSNVKLGDGIGLWEAQAIDDYESEEIQKQKRARDEKDDWTSISSDVLQRCHSSLSFFDANGMRFHLPAYIIGSLKEEIDDPVFHLTHLDDYAKSKLTTLSSDQVKAVVNYLNWCLETQEYEYEHPMIEKALNAYWSQKI
jgi:hypothetical protein